jgi:hypothetical protein
MNDGGELKEKISFFLFCFVAGSKLTNYFCNAFERNTNRSSISTESRTDKGNNVYYQ